ncbi:MAG: hypothetical protein WKG01_04150 [Kofleriaceae bacterium]
MTGRAGVTTVTIPPLAADWPWATIVACVKRHYATYDLRFVEHEPATGIYLEAVVGGTGEELGWARNELFGIAAADNFCNITERGIAFSFSETHRQVARRVDELCATIAHEIGHLVSLEHEGLAQDAMSYVLIADAGTKGFLPQLATCGPDPAQPASCTCNPGGMTSSGQRLAHFIGSPSTETVPPVVALERPGDTAPPTFEVVATAIDDLAIAVVVVRLDGVEVGADTEPEHTRYRIPVRDAPEGEHVLALIAYDEAGNATTAESALTIRLPACTIADDTCPSGFACEHEVCVEHGGGCGCASGHPAGLGLLVLGLRARRRSPRRRL